MGPGIRNLHVTGAGSVIILVALLALSCPGYAAYSGPLEVMLVPFITTAPDAPDDLYAQLLDDLRAELANQPNIDVNEMDLRSPIFKRAFQHLAGGERVEFETSLTLVADVRADPEQRRHAAAVIADVLDVDAVVYGSFDQYEFTQNPDPRQTKIRLLAMKVEPDATRQGVASSLTVIGRSTIYPNGRGEKLVHDAKATADAAVKFAALLTEDAATISARTHEDAVQQPAKPVKADSRWRWFAAFGAVVVAALGAGG